MQRSDYYPPPPDLPLGGGGEIGFQRADPAEKGEEEGYPLFNFCGGEGYFCCLGVGLVLVGAGVRGGEGAGEERAVGFEGGKEEEFGFRGEVEV